MHVKGQFQDFMGPWILNFCSGELHDMTCLQANIKSYKLALIPRRVSSNVDDFSVCLCLFQCCVQVTSKRLVP